MNFSPPQPGDGPWPWLCPPPTFSLGKNNMKCENCETLKGFLKLKIASLINEALTTGQVPEGVEDFSTEAVVNASVDIAFKEAE